MLMNAFEPRTRLAGGRDCRFCTFFVPGDSRNPTAEVSRSIVFKFCWLYKYDATRIYLSLEVFANTNLDLDNVLSDR